MDNILLLKYIKKHEPIGVIQLHKSTYLSVTFSGT